MQASEKREMTCSQATQEASFYNWLAPAGESGCPRFLSFFFAQAPDIV
jgi:hypothetical protein